jgi:hypothetical protein
MAKFLERGHDDVLRNESVMVKCRPIRLGQSLPRRLAWACHHARQPAWLVPIEGAVTLELCEADEFDKLNIAEIS